MATAPIKPLINIDSHIDANAKQWILYSEKSSDWSSEYCLPAWGMSRACLNSISTYNDKLFWSQSSIYFVFSD